MTFCNWIDNKCEKCGFVNKSGNPHQIRKCKPVPTLGQRILNFIPALTTHIMNGRPKCTQEQIEQRLAVCKECPLFVANTCTHDSCGCNIKDTQTFFNKLYWADQKCPIGKWDEIKPSG